MPAFSAGLPAFTLATCAPAAIALLTERALSPERRVHDLAVLDQRLGDLLDLVDRDREAQATCAVGQRLTRGVDADHLRSPC